jgi:hypothetical protein
MEMLLASPIPLKDKEIYELNINEDFSTIKITKIGRLAMYFHFLILLL